MNSQIRFVVDKSGSSSFSGIKRNSWSFNDPRKKEGLKMLSTNNIHTHFGIT